MVERYIKAHAGDCIVCWMRGLSSENSEYLKEEYVLKRAYRKPQAQMVDFSYDTQIVAESKPYYERGENTQWELFDKCQAKATTCETLYKVDIAWGDCVLDEGIGFSLRRP